jgi:hypothetical protein
MSQGTPKFGCTLTSGVIRAPARPARPAPRQKVTKRTSRVSMPSACANSSFITTARATMPIWVRRALSELDFAAEIQRDTLNNDDIQTSSRQDRVKRPHVKASEHAPLGRSMRSRLLTPRTHLRKRGLPSVRRCDRTASGTQGTRACRVRRTGSWITSPTRNVPDSSRMIATDRWL